MRTLRRRGEPVMSMDLELTDDQQLFRETTRKFLDAECSLDVVRSLAGDPAGFDPDLWRRGADLGWTAMLVDEVDGGGTISGHGILDLAIVAEEMGRTVAPGPLLPTNIVAGALADAGSDSRRVIPGLVAGDEVAAWCAPGIARWYVEAVERNGGFALSGTTSPVEAAAQARHLLVTARTGGSLTQFLVPTDAAGVSIVPMGTIDLVKRVAKVRFDDVTVPASAVVGDIGAANPAVGRQFQIAIVVQCAETVGVMDRVFEFTLEYVADRYSFGRPLASYQALKHRFAQMKMWLEACHAIAGAAARGVQNDQADAAEVTSAAKAYIGAHATDLVQECIQMHGGIGVTWEHDLHFYLRRATFNRAMYGTPADHRQRIYAGMEGVRA
jgi:alkylation response protein AidB-like acyl-CoA dehydrogenase